MARGMLAHVLLAACALRCALAEEKDLTDAQALVQREVAMRSAQPLYARPHEHGYDKAKNALIKSGQEIDSMLKDAKKALQNITSVLHTGSLAEKRCNLSTPEEGAASYVVDNTRLQAPTKGVGYRFRKALWDRDLKTVAHWGSTIRGVDHGDGWLKVGDCFLPMDVQDVPVMQLQQKASRPRLAMSPSSLIQVEGAPILYGTPEYNKIAQPEVGTEVQLARLDRETDKNGLKPGLDKTTVDKNGVRLGDRMEVVVLSGPASGKWVKCFVEGRNSEGNAYHVYIPQAPERQQHATNVPLKLLRRPETSEKSDGVLLFWAVSGKERIIDLVKKNIQHLRQTYSGKAEVYLVHIDDGKDDWLEMANETWYNKNVQFSEERKIPKQLQASASMLFASSYYPPQLRLAKAFLPEVLAKRQYDWIWILDEDIDFSGADLNKLFHDAEKTGSLIVGPSVKFEDHLGNRALEKMYVPGCGFTNRMCFVHTPKPKCLYRYVNYVEAMFPILRPAVFKEIFESCADCLTQVDRLWCARSANQLIHAPDEACAILDQVSVTHVNGKTLRKWEDVSRSHDIRGDVRQAHPEDWVDVPDIGAFKCVGEYDDII